MMTFNFNFTVKQHPRAARQSDYDKHPAWIVLYASTMTARQLKRHACLPLLVKRRKKRLPAATDSEPCTAELPNARASHIAYACIDEAMSAFERLTLARKLVAVHSKRQARQIAVVIAGFDKSQQARLAEAVVAAAAAAAVSLPSFKQKQPPAGAQRLHLFGLKQTLDLKQTLAEAEGNALARTLSVLPANKLTPGRYLKIINQLAKANRWRLTFYDQKTLKRKKAGAFLAVVQGSAAADAGIVRLRYVPQKKPAKTLALVGKGLCYDTGGTNLKPAKSMYGMHEDMQGSAVALGTLLALGRLGPDYAIECWLALAMNHIGPKAYKPNDVVTASDGTSIEVVHTDAEGRMVLADTLALLSAHKPDMIIDFATLTGTCMQALGTAYSGVFSNRPALYPQLIATGVKCGERIWPFPLDEDYDAALESQIADIRQCALEGDADHILAARFLQRFVKHDIPWVHIDLAASHHVGGLAHIATDTTGFGVRYTVSMMQTQRLDKLSL